MKRLSQLLSKGAIIALLALSAVACSEDNVIAGNITIAESELNKTIAWNEVESSIAFTANDNWTLSFPRFPRELPTPNSVGSR